MIGGSPSHSVDHHSALPDENSEEFGQPKVQLWFTSVCITNDRLFSFFEVNIFLSSMSSCLAGGVHCGSMTTALIFLLPVANLSGP